MKSTLVRFHQERSFGRTVGTVLVLIGLYQIVRGRLSLGEASAAVGALLAVLGTFAPRTLVVSSRYWWRFAHALGWFNSRVLLTLFYLGVVTPLGIAWRLMGRDPFSQRRTTSTWLAYPESRRQRQHYEHIF